MKKVRKKIYLNPIDYPTTFYVYTDNFMKVYKLVWEHFDKRFSGKHKKPGQKDYMIVDEFDEFVTSSGLLGDDLTAIDLSLIFNLSM